MSRDVQVPVHQIETWRKEFLESGLAGLKRRGGDPEERALRQNPSQGRGIDDATAAGRNAFREKGLRGRADEVETVAGMVSPTTGRRYPVTMVCRVWRVARSSVYAHRTPEGPPPGPARKRGPRTPVSDADVVAAIRTVLEASPFHTEGHRKVRVRLRPHGIWVSRKRVLRLMRQQGLLAPHRRRHARGDRAHAGTITTSRPNELCGTDATRFWTRQDGWCGFFGAIDHCVADIVGWHVAKRGACWAALESIRQGVQHTHGAYARQWAAMDWGPHYTAHQFLGELRWLGIRPSPSYVGEPECNGIIERCIRRLKEECLYLHDLDTLDEARQVIGEFIERYNREWLLERHGHRTPTAVRQALTKKAA